jgi:hypothetical protein
MEIYDAVAIAILVPFTVLYLLYRIDPRYLIALSLVLLVSSAVESAIGNTNAANDIAIVFFYCLAVGVLLMIVDDYLDRMHHRSVRLRRFISSLYFWLSEHVSKHRTLLSEYAMPAALFSLLSLLILGPLLNGGYILVTDMVFGPRVALSGIYGLSPFLGGGNSLAVFEYLLYAFIPGWAVEDILLFLIFFLSGFTMFRFSRHFGLNGLSCYFASIFYVVNPFVYARMLAGAWGLLFAYSISPLAFLFFIKLLDSAEGREMWKHAAWTAIVFSVVDVFDIHTFVLDVALSALYFVVRLFYVYGERFAARLFAEVKAIALLIAFLAVLNLYWLLYSVYSTQKIIGTFSFLDAIAFESSPTVFNNTMLSVAAMYGFFRTGYPYPITVFPPLLLIFLLFLFLSIYGLLYFYRDSKRGPACITLSIAAVLSVALATGLSSPLTSGLYTFLYDNVPLFNGFREPQKFVALLVFAYSFLGGLGVLQIQSWLEGKGLHTGVGGMRAHAHALIVIAIAVVLLSPFIYSYMEIDSFDGQLTAVQYPASWYRAEAIMNQNNSDYSVLVLPWHGYMYYNWSGTKFASPFNQFFRQNLISGGQNTYLSGQGESGTFSSLMFSILKERNSITHLGNLLSLMDVKYVFLSKSADYWNYSFLYVQSDLRLVENSSSSALFENMHPVSRAYIVHSIQTVSGYDQLINLSARLNMLDYGWIVAAGHSAAGNVSYGNSSYLLLASEKISDASYQVYVPGILDFGYQNYLIFVPPSVSEAGWQTSPGLVSYLSGNASMSSASAVGLIYEVSGGPATITIYFSPFQLLRVGYIISGLGLIVLLLALVALPLYSQGKESSVRTFWAFRRRIQ